MSQQLDLYNGALLIIGQSPLASLTANEPARRLLDQVWNDKFIDNALECGDWNFAIRSVKADYDSNVTPALGYAYAVEKPSDWRRTSGFCADEYFRIPITRYIDESGYWYSDYSSVYVRYVSNDPNYGGDTTKWPEAFRDWLKARLASRIVRNLANSQSETARIQKLERDALVDARSKCAMNGPSQPLPLGTWVRSRTARNWYRSSQ